MSRFQFQDGTSYRFDIPNINQSITATGAVGVHLRNTAPGDKTQAWTAARDSYGKFFLYTVALPEQEPNILHFIGYNSNDDVDAANTGEGHHNPVVFFGDENEGYTFLLGDLHNAVIVVGTPDDRWLRIAPSSDDRFFIQLAS